MKFKELFLSTKSLKIEKAMIALTEGENSRR